MWNSKNWLIGLFLFFFSSFSLQAQIFSPNLLCVKSDTLVWDLPVNTCGSFNSYIVYASTEINGPYFVLATITDQNQTTYFHDNANNMVWYYYMTTDANCSGEPILASDTLDSRPPEVSPLIFADIVDGKVLLQWNPSSSPEVIGYIIYRVKEIGTVPIDTVTTVTYYDLDSNPDMQAENYYVIALDACGNTSLLTTPHRTVLLDGEVNTCDQSISLHWNLYEGWTAIDRQEIWVGLNGVTPSLQQTLTAGDTSTTVGNLMDESTYCFFIRSYDAVTGLSSTSNEICLSINIIAPIRDLILKNISVTASDEIALSWQWNIDAELSDYSILTSATNSDYTVVETLPGSNPLQLNNAYTHLMSSPSSGPVYYQIQTADLCDSTAQSNYGASIYLSGQANDDVQNLLSWTPFVLENAQINHYDIYRVGATGDLPIAQVAADEFSFSDIADPRRESDASICYYIVAEAIVPLPGAVNEVVYSRSNIICVEQPTTILAPNAFAPDGKNFEFRPLLRFGQSADYQMTIWDRWGQKIFESDDINTGWTGRKGYLEYPMGAYTFQIKVTQMDGRLVQKTGVVMLIR